ncbi:hypothetical protein [Quadrisphaera setariae]|uniref:Uncharacterized protein n=1 Tax=Quadrisphaera setariae TaxID=2593304 RepID=A0A5C8Z2M8_9ACTN|nr:hypothetical protein [Quadrisphaera setariae]TXR51554.1 hypothetical protein FMM08_22380 [Quadrisphaera setariae]
MHASPHLSHVTDHYGIPTSPPVPFLDVDVVDDKPMFIDPHAVRLSGGPQPFAAQAVQCLETFFHEVTACVVSQRQSDQARGLALLQRFEEPWETRLGLAAAGFHGHGGADDVGTWIWNALSGDLQALLRVGLLTQVEDIPLFVEGVGVDITSDLTTRIIYQPLADFTAAMVAQYPQFTAGAHTTRRVDKQVWDPSAKAWVMAQVELPVAAGGELLLVPKDWARPSLLLNATRFYETSVLSHVQLERASRTAQGRLLKPRKEDLKGQEDLARGRETILEVVMRAYRDQINVLRDFKTFVDAKYEPLDEQDIARKLA